LVQSVSPTSGPTPLTVSFDLTGSHWSDNRPIQYLVDPTFDPNTGSTETGLSTNATLSPTPLRQFTYTQSGTYTALVGIFDANTGQLGDATVQISVTEPPQAFTVSSFSAPVDNGAAVNVANSGRTIPLKFRVTDRTGSPVSNLTANQVSVTANVGPCSNGTQTLDAIESYATASGLANLGNGYYQYDYKTLKTWAGQCATLTVKTPLTGTRTANFMFTK